MFVYCGNQPINRVDSAGNFWGIIVGYKLGEIIIRACNDSHNQKAEMNPETSTKNKLINDQNGLTGNSYRYGSYDVSHNGCEVIAVHNAMVLLGMDSTFTDRTNDFYATEAIIGDSFFGSNPYEIGKVLRRNNIEYTRVGIDEMGEAGVYIISYWNSNAPWDGLHTIAIYYDGTQYISYNVGSKAQKFDPNDYNNRRFICAYYLGGVTK